MSFVFPVCLRFPGTHVVSTPSGRRLLNLGPTSVCPDGRHRGKGSPVPSFGVCSGLSSPVLLDVGCSGVPSVPPLHVPFTDLRRGVVRPWEKVLPVLRKSGLRPIDTNPGTVEPDTPTNVSVVSWCLSRTRRSDVSVVGLPVL